MPSSVDVHGHENYEEDEDTGIIQLRLQHRSMYDEEPQHRHRRRRRRSHLHVERESNENNDNSQISMEQCRICIARSCSRTGEFLNKVLMHWCKFF